MQISSEGSWYSKVYYILTLPSVVEKRYTVTSTCSVIAIMLY